MAGHFNIVQPAEEPLSKSDRIALAEKYERLRDSVHRSPLAPYCLADLLRIFDFNKQLVAGETPDHPGLEDAARNVLRNAHLKLKEVEPTGPLSDLLAAGLHFPMLEARGALQELYGSPGTVKAIELEECAGDPRAICWGSGFELRTDRGGDNNLPWIVAERTGRSSVSSASFGCFRVFVDTTQTARHPWRAWCDACPPSRGQVHRKWKREIRRRWVDYALR